MRIKIQIYRIIFPKIKKNQQLLAYFCSVRFIVCRLLSWFDLWCCVLYFVIFFFLLLFLPWCETFFFPESVPFFRVCKISYWLALVQSFLVSLTHRFFVLFFFVWIIFACVFGLLLFFSLEFGRLHINSRWFGCCEWSNALK